MTIVHAAGAKSLYALGEGSAALPILTQLYNDGMVYFGVSQSTVAAYLMLIWLARARFQAMWYNYSPSSSQSRNILANTSLSGSQHPIFSSLPPATVSTPSRASLGVDSHYDFANLSRGTKKFAQSF